MESPTPTPPETPPVPRRPRRFPRSAALAVALVAAIGAGLAVVPGDASAARVVSVDDRSPRESMLSVYSPSMKRVVRNRVLHLPGKPYAPVFYMLPGVGGAEDGISWYDNTHIKQFFAGKRVNVVMPIGGRGSLFTDWDHDDPVLGRNKWQTYLTRELPPLVNRTMNGTGVNAISGVSMSGGPALDLATQAPWLYRAVASYSGCPGTANPLGAAAVVAMVTREGGNVGNLWGPPGPRWAAHDPIRNAAKLRGKTIFLSAASGVPGRIDGRITDRLAGLAGGGVIEAVTRDCTAAMSARLHRLGIGHTFVSRRHGSHSWGLFSADMKSSWPQIARAIGA